MNSKLKYKTKQRDILVNYLREASGHITASDVCEYFKEHGSPIGQSTVYRQLESLVDEGIINKYIIDAGSPACFEYVGEHHGEGDKVCYHCKCEKCGKLIHLHCDEISELQEHLFKEHKFKLDPKRTVFYGYCEECN